MNMRGSLLPLPFPFLPSHLSLAFFISEKKLPMASTKPSWLDGKTILVGEHKLVGGENLLEMRDSTSLKGKPAELRKMLKTLETNMKNKKIS